MKFILFIIVLVTIFGSLTTKAQFGGLTYEQTAELSKKDPTFKRDKDTCYFDNRNIGTFPQTPAEMEYNDRMDIRYDQCLYVAVAAAKRRQAAKTASALRPVPATNLPQQANEKQSGSNGVFLAYAERTTYGWDRMWWTVGRDESHALEGLKKKQGSCANCKRVLKCEGPGWFAAVSVTGGYHGRYDPEGYYGASCGHSSSGTAISDARSRCSQIRGSKYCTDSDRTMNATSDYDFRTSCFYGYVDGSVQHNKYGGMANISEC